MYHRFNEMQNKSRQLTQQETEEILEKGVYGTLAVICENGYPYSVPLNYVYHEGTLYVHGKKDGQKMVSMQHNNKVSFSVVGSMTVIPEKTSTSYRSAIIFGTARVLSDEEKRPAIELIARKYSSEYMDVAQKTIDAMWDQFCVVAINVEHLTGKAG